MFRTYYAWACTARLIKLGPNITTTALPASDGKNALASMWVASHTAPASSVTRNAVV
jgi:hypothetical protein